VSSSNIIKSKTPSPSARKDPPRAAVDRSLQQGAIKGGDPTKHYVWAYKVGLGGVGYYENLGYEVEIKRPGGPFCVSLRKGLGDGQPIEWQDNVLMSIEKTILAEQEAIAQLEVDALERRILSPGGVVDGLRGISGTRARDNSAAISLENETTGESVMLG
jgi:hypothetical protein